LARRNSPLGFHRTGKKVEDPPQEGANGIRIGNRYSSIRMAMIRDFKDLAKSLFGWNGKTF